MHKKSLQKLIDNVMRKLLSKDVCDLQTLDYSEYGPLSDSAKPSDGILKVLVIRTTILHLLRYLIQTIIFVEPP